MAIKVKLRQKRISGNRLSLYLDFYPPILHHKTGELTRRQFLKMYIHSKPKNPLDKLHNNEQLKLAEQIRQKKENTLNKPEIYTGYEQEQLKIKERNEQNFVEYFKELAEKRKSSNHDNWMSALRYLERFTEGELKFKDLNVEFCIDFRDFLLTTKSNKSIKVNLAQNSAVSYFNKLKAALKEAYKKGHLPIDLNARIDSIKPAETRREFLTIEELNALVKTECNNPLLKRAALFSALTGLRFSDIKKLTWKEIEHIKKKGYYIKFQQQKTKGIEMLPISEQAVIILGKKGKSDENVFAGLTYSAYENKHLYQWIGAAGITKNITFHCFRHTYATLLLSEGVDLFTVSKMLGHREIKTTQIYAKVMDASKRSASNKIKLKL